MPEENELIHVAMQIILHAGNARNYLNEALEYAKKFDFIQAEEKMAEASAEIILAHKSQTSTVQNEMSGKSYDYSLLFNHAQDTLMTVMSEINIGQQLIDILKLIKKGEE
ncbi:Lichenan-specific phosphotransferase enzyme IIA component [Streptococcus constellatus]|uniref:Lichenan-specific phosphotransferase enzyme IIA component n=1 Tax=Streptococcus constellatus TaxID=76860 RepID=A0A564TPL3_STRCV|nr:PTS lactose/cellobiose transporter subunit IIA [Streptococcus constellatus]VUX02252.1 Lichenan-specific phosphotransferase enzyme IIA component [Streptococcus gordonii]VUX09197.1 Lichenan-specific phosphotransferase enzyme IIA component [Streptococcus constellatus]